MVSEHNGFPLGRLAYMYVVRELLCALPVRYSIFQYCDWIRVDLREIMNCIINT